MEYESIHRETRAREFFIASSRDEEMVEYESSITYSKLVASRNLAMKLIHTP